MPPDPAASIRDLEAAVRAGRISRRRIDTSAAKVLAAKQRAGLFRSRLVNLDTISEGIHEDKLDALARSVAERAFTLVRDEKHLFPAPALEAPAWSLCGKARSRRAARHYRENLRAAYRP